MKLIRLSSSERSARGTRFDCTAEVPTEVTLPAVTGVQPDSAMDAFDVTALTLRYGPMVLRRCRQLLRDEDEALDACQDVFVRVLERQARLVARYPSSLLYRIATNVCLNRIRDRRRNPETADEARLYEIATAEDGGAGTEARVLLERLFGRHPASSRTIAVLHHVDGLTLDQVAAETGLSVSGVRKRLRRLRETLVEMAHGR
jgi:RNA polymerase sigma-70 factor, ECF subfamily